MNGTKELFEHYEIPGPYSETKEAAFVPSGGEPVRGERLELDFLDGKHDAMPLQSPMGIWIVSVGKWVNVEKCEAIQFDFHLSYRV